MTHKEKQEMCLLCPNSKYYSGVHTKKIYCEVEDKYIVFDHHDGWQRYKTLHTVASPIVTDIS